MHKTIVRIPQPCPESWAAMTPANAGRHCAACQQVVVDFTQQTDAEILAHLARAGGRSCGRFRAEQLGRPLRAAATASRWRSWLASVLALGGVLGSGRVAAQASGTQSSGGPAPITSSSLSINNQPLKAAEIPTATPSGAGGPLVVRGIVTDATTGDRLPGATVALQGTSRNVFTEASGEFELTLTEHEAAGILVVSSVGYTSQPVAITGFRTAAPLTIALKADVLGMGEVIVVGGYNIRTPRPYPWHPRVFFSWGKYWLTRPFRRY